MIRLTVRSVFAQDDIPSTTLPLLDIPLNNGSTEVTKGHAAHLIWIIFRQCSSCLSAGAQHSWPGHHPCHLLSIHLQILRVDVRTPFHFQVPETKLLVQIQYKPNRTRRSNLRIQKPQYDKKQDFASTWRFVKGTASDSQCGGCGKPAGCVICCCCKHLLTLPTCTQVNQVKYIHGPHSFTHTHERTHNRTLNSKAQFFFF